MDASPKPYLPGERRLTAVMFTDVVNFSTLAEANEEQTLTAVRRDLQVMFELLDRHQGKLLKTLGDGLLAYFQSAVNAVNCAQEMQLRIAATPVAVGVLALKHRIGIHLGEVFVSENDILGNGVNIAARLQTKAAPGGICISQTVFDAVRQQIELRVNYLGPQELKNIRDSVPAYQLLPMEKIPTVRATSASQHGPVGRTAAISPGFRFEIGHGSPVKPGPGQAANILVLGDFSGRASRGIVEPIGSRAPLLLDFDTFESLFAGLDLRLSLPVCDGQGETLELRFASMDDFHPDSLLRNVPRLASLLSHRSGLGYASSSGPAAADFVRLLALAETAAASGPQKPTSLRDAVDAALAHQLRAILHHPDFQSLEAAWRGNALLVRDFGTEANMCFQVLDLSRQELAIELAAFNPAAESGLVHLFAENRFTLCLANYYSGPELDDIQLLSRLGQLAARAGLPVLTAGRPELVRCESFGRQPAHTEWHLALPHAEAWNELRRSPAAAYLGVALPRFLVRQPYGAGSDPIESFPFEELPPSLPHESYLWGNPVFACGHLVARSLARPNRSAIPSGGQIGGLPLHSFKEGGEGTVKPGAEAWLTDQAATVIERCGLIPLRSVKNANALLIPHFQSLAAPARPLAWRRL